MYPRAELNRLAVRKALLQARIAVRRLECLQHGHALAQPLNFADRVWAFWQSIAPMVKLVGVPAALWAGGKLFRRGDGFGGKFAGLLKYAPVVMQVARVFAQARARAGGGVH